MSEFKGTKGEWKYSIHNGRIIFNKPNMDLWFHDEGNNFKEKPKEVLANAKLIAAAPDMLEACLRFVEDFEGDYMVGGEIVDNPHHILISNYKQAKKAIQKALK